MALLCKKNKFQFLTIACLIILIASGTAASTPVGLVPPSPPAFSTLYVGGGSGNYTTIQAAVDNASPGDTIIVYPGTYTEVIDVDVANLTIRSLSGNPDDTIVRTFSPSHNFKVIANNVTISGFNITGEGYYTGVFITGVSGVNIINNKFSGNDCAIQMESSGGCNLINNTVSDSTSYGFYLSSPSNCLLANNTISNTEYQGIYLYYSGSCGLTGNTVSDTGYEGIYLSNSSNCNLVNNTVSNSGYDGIYLYYSGRCNLTDNIVSDSYDNGITLYSSENCNLSGNTISNPYDDGILLYYAGSSILTNNTVSNSDYGIYIEDSDGTVMRNNTVSSGEYGLELDNVKNCTLEDNIMSGNRYNFGFSVDDYDHSNNTGNIIDTSNLVDGKPIYFLEGEPDPSIGSNAGAIYCINCGNVEIKDVVLQNVTNGISLYNTSANLANNTINNTKIGIGLAYLQDVSISDSKVKNSNYGIGLQYTENVTIVDNSVRNSTCGVYMNNSESCTLKGNSVQDATESYGLLSSRNSGLVRSEENNLLTGTTLFTSELVQARRVYGFGIYSRYCRGIRLANNAVDRAGYKGIYFEDCQGAVIAHNSVNDVGYHGIHLYNSSSVEFIDNTVRNVTFTYDRFTSANSPLVSSSLVSDSQKSGFGIFFDEIRDFRLEGNYVEDSSQVVGICLYEPVNATLKSNTLENCKIGLAVLDGYNCSVSDCSVTNCSSGGILIQNYQAGEGAEYTVTGCTVDGSAFGLLVTGKSILADNTLTGNSYGLVIYDMNNSLIYGNTIVENSLAGLAIDLDQTEIFSRIGLEGSMEKPESGNNTIYNNYLSNVNNTLIYSEANNSWNTSKTSGESIVGGPYLGGNYWANPSGTGFSENCTDSDKDGIADSSYEFVNGTFDYLPLTEIPSTTTKHRSSANYIPSSGNSTGVSGIDSAQKRVVAGSKTSFSFNNPVSGIMGLSFTSQLYSGNVIVRIELLEADRYEKTPESAIYQMMNILVGNERFESENNINAASVNFRVSKSWVEENNIDVSTITINRFNEDEWNALPTEMTSEDEEYYYFTAETPGLSRYAITGEELGTVVITPTEEEEPVTITGEEQTTDRDKKAPGFESAFVIFGILASEFLAKKRIMK
ncbi:hypothetical protein MSSIT_1617 [Methanosarcina siciliae T4/M]|uniref:Carbohydrate-binding/sugar hydrolysis domain-containing protein n=1 Tax=Methanosarcina siciliae T4/M TaxID=1434120 RepID=A0A0E3L8D6_9EURY|nr:right-handed parallel beta-helix repeat-containing protein [Methanosarcina siciliae]AKB28336.1 hypothetical protein MSSIT_1617 [Methanosarcina siciliae T4/M]